MNRHNLPLARHAATDMSAIGWAMIANSSNCLISPVWLASIVEGDSIINAALLLMVNIHCVTSPACHSECSEFYAYCFRVLQDRYLFLLDTFPAAELLNNVLAHVLSECFGTNRIQENVTAKINIVDKLC